MNKIALYWIEPDSPPDNFPAIENALSHPDGLLCFGGDLSDERLLCAYERGIFPWYSEGQPIMWWSPSPRCVIYPDELVIRRSLKKSMRNGGYNFSMDQAFSDVIRCCAAPREDEAGTWITDAMQDAYRHLHALGYAHSVEIWKNDQLVGGLYGIAIGQVFFGESMFSTQRDTSKIALACLIHRIRDAGFKLIDAQVTSGHLISLGAREIERSRFHSELTTYCHMENTIDLWQTGPMPVKEFLFSNE
jgi:leucyl/phenylalanyl-tRNA--protein transferase